ncbi:MAG: histidine kinase [Epsilonproteobacteria bacterium]|nr:histidine kinase [Campylobacterota bacterium]
MLFSEKNISKLIILTPIFTIIILTTFVTLFLVNSQNRYFEKQSKLLEKKYILKQKALLVSEVNKVIKYIEYNRVNLKNISEKKLKKFITSYIDTIRYEDNGYIWIHNTDYYLISHPFRKKSVGKYDINLKDESGKFITRAFVNIAVSNPDGGFLDYYWRKPNAKTATKKLGFVKLYPPWKWVVGSGLYMDDISNSIKKEKDLLQKRINKQIQTIVLIALTFMFLVGILSFLISKNIINALNSYKQKVNENEITLKTKIIDAIKESQKKDRTLFYQSRLAQMGEMLSMIAHQWKQPLSEISGIFMELETAYKFKKLNDKYILECAKDGDKITDFMSRTIEDFRNFFKPDKTKKRFYINSAVDEALRLIGATITSSNIQIIRDEMKNIAIYGYPNEFAQVILNICLNARDALVFRKIKKPKINLHIYKKETKSFLKISDNAGGIEKEIMEKIFDPYFSTKEKVDGTGLGLYMSKMIIEKSMNGKLVAENLKEGACFIIEVQNVK